MTKIKLFFVSILLFYSSTFFFQKQLSKDLLYVEVKKKAREFKSEINFDKAHLFFIKKNWDSTLVYSMKQLIFNDHNDELRDYCHYFRAFSFKQKNLLKEAKNEFNTVSNKFPFYYKVKIYLGEISLELRDFSKAIVYFKEIEKLSNVDTLDFKRSTVFHNLGLSYLHLNKFDKAEEYLFKSADLQKIEMDTLLLISSYMDIANLYYVQYEDRKAIPYFQKAYLLSKKVKNFELKTETAMNMAVVEENRKNFPLALVFRKEYESWKDSLTDQNKIWKVAQLEKEFAVKQKQKEVSLLEAENKIKIAERNGLLYSAIVLLLLLVTAVYFYREKIKRNKIILSQKEELDELNATKDKLFSIVSHDLRSSVSALKTSNAKLVENLQIKNFAELDKLLHRNSAIANGAYNLLDNLLNWALLQTKQLYFHQESLHLHSIIQQIEYNYKPLMVTKNLSFDNGVPRNVFVFADLESLKIILRNLLDNAIKFSNENEAVLIYTRESNDGLCNLVIEDSGLGMNETSRQELLKETILLSKKRNNEMVGTGLGMQLCKTMIRKNGGKLGIESQENIGTKIIVMVPKFENHG
jgi:signal transduction histidine kinase